MENNEAKKLTIREAEYIEQFFLTFNKTESARRAKYKNPGVAGFEVYNRPHVQAEIKRRFEEKHISSDEVKARVSDISKMDMSDYIIMEKEFYTPKVKKTLVQLIQEQLATINRLERYRERATIDEDHKEGIARQIQRIKNDIIEMEIELEDNPKAWRIVDGEPEEREVSKLDLKKIKEDKRLNKIKSISQKPNGEIKIETYDAQAAVRDAGKMHGIFKEDNEQAATKVIHTISEEEAKQIIKAVKDSI